MIKTINECVGCHLELGCTGSSCLHSNVPHTFCDNCKDESVIYSFPDDDVQLCEKCMESELDAEWKQLSFKEKCEYFGVKEIDI